MWTQHPSTYLQDKTLREWTKRVHQLSKRISTTRSKRKIKELRIVRARIRKRVRLRIKELQRERVNNSTKILEDSKGNKRAFEAQRLLRKGNRKPLQLQDE